MADEDLIRFTNCSLTLENGSQANRDLWVDAEKGKIIDSQVYSVPASVRNHLRLPSIGNFLYCQKTSWKNSGLGGEHPQVIPFRFGCRYGIGLRQLFSPGLLDIQINGAYGFDFSIYKDDASYVDGLKMVAERIVETGVTG